jgi:hypothetical protein
MRYILNDILFCITLPDSPVYIVELLFTDLWLGFFNVLWALCAFLGELAPSAW